MAFDFPNAPAVDETFQPSGGPLYRWTGVAWVSGVAASSGTSGGGTNFKGQLVATPVGAKGSSIEQTIPDWFAGAPIISVPNDAVIAPVHRGSWLFMLNDVGSIILLPNNWVPGQAFGARQVGLGPVNWQLAAGATLQLPFTRSGHTQISEQFEQVVFMVVANASGTAAVWTISGSTA